MFSAGLISSHTKPNGIITGNLASNAGVTYTYGSSSHKHAVTSTSGGGSYSYDANGNQTSHTVGSQTYTLLYDAENRLVQVKLGRTIQSRRLRLRAVLIQAEI